MPALVEHLFRRSSGRLVASLTRTFGPSRLDLAEEVVQEALLKALKVWPFRGVPDDPEAWLRRVARNKALDVLRREGHVEESTDPNALRGRASPESPSPPTEDVPSLRPGGAGDDDLAMIFMCCHPALPFDARVALTLRTVGGLSTDEIAAAFLVPRSTVQQRIVRAKRVLADGRVSLALPSGSALAHRRDAVLAVLYLMFNEGYAATEGEALVRFELCGEAIRLARLLAAREDVGGPEACALLALLLFQASRLPTRSGDDGALLVLQDQDRSRWDRSLMAEGFHWLERATAAPHLTRYHLEAGIAAGHAAAPSWEGTDWPRILDLYDLLTDLVPSPVVEVNRSVVLALARSPEEGLSALDRVDATRLAGFALLPATRGYLLALAGRNAEAAVELRRALMASRSAPVRRHLERRLLELETRPSPSASQEQG